jgi:signal transduction histidine kinase
VDLARLEREGHMGLTGMRERLAALGGAVELSGAGGGTRIRVTLPRGVVVEP